MTELIVLGPAWVVYGYNPFTGQYEAQVYDDTDDGLTSAQRFANAFPEVCHIEYVAFNKIRGYDIGKDEYDTEANYTFENDTGPYPAA